MVRYSNQWPAHLEAILIKLVPQGLSFTQIGQRLGKSRNAVGGKVKRFRARGLL